MWNDPTTTSTWLSPGTKLRVRAGAFTLYLENIGAAAASEGESYYQVRKHRGMGEVWRARSGQHARSGQRARPVQKRARRGQRRQRWQARLAGPFEGEGSVALRQLMQQ